jgi:putative flippase GtrA
MILGTYILSDLPLADEADRLRQLAARLPRVLRFLTIGGFGLVTDLGAFSLLHLHAPYPLATRILSLAAATLVTWRLNRALTFDRSGRRQSEEAMRYAFVTLVAQGTSYAIFAALVLTALAARPQIALLIGAGCASILSYNGHRLFAFAAKRGAIPGVRVP